MHFKLSVFNSIISQTQILNLLTALCFNVWHRMSVAKRLLTGSGQQCVPLHTLFATCALEQADLGKPSWSQEHHDTPTSAGTGTDTPPAGPPGAWDARENIKHMEYVCTVLCERARTCCRVSVNYTFCLF